MDISPQHCPLKAIFLLIYKWIKFTSENSFKDLSICTIHCCSFFKPIKKCHVRREIPLDIFSIKKPLEIFNAPGTRSYTATLPQGFSVNCKLFRCHRA